VPCSLVEVDKSSPDGRSNKNLRNDGKLLPDYMCNDAEDNRLLKNCYKMNSLCMFRSFSVQNVFPLNIKDHQSCMNINLK
jgi:hypothetical protein